MYRWFKDGTPMTDFTSSQYYRIQNTRREDAGVYNCIARNDAGSIFSEQIDVVVACRYSRLIIEKHLMYFVSYLL